MKSAAFKGQRTANAGNEPSKPRSSIGELLDFAARGVRWQSYKHKTPTNEELKKGQALSKTFKSLLRSNSPVPDKPASSASSVTTRKPPSPQPPSPERKPSGPPTQFITIDSQPQREGLATRHKWVDEAVNGLTFSAYDPRELRTPGTQTRAISSTKGVTPLSRLALQVTPRESATPSPGRSISAPRPRPFHTRFAASLPHQRHPGFNLKRDYLSSKDTSDHINPDRLPLAQRLGEFFSQQPEKKPHKQSQSSTSVSGSRFLQHPSYKPNSSSIYSVSVSEPGGKGGEGHRLNEERSITPARTFLLRRKYSTAVAVKDTYHPPETDRRRLNLFEKEEEEQQQQQQQQQEQHETGGNGSNGAASFSIQHPVETGSVAQSTPEKDRDVRLTYRKAMAWAGASGSVVEDVIDHLSVAGSVDDHHRELRFEDLDEPPTSPAESEADTALVEPSNATPPSSRSVTTPLGLSNGSGGSGKNEQSEEDIRPRRDTAWWKTPQPRKPGPRAVLRGSATIRKHISNRWNQAGHSSSPPSNEDSLSPPVNPSSTTEEQQLPSRALSRPLEVKQASSNTYSASAAPPPPPPPDGPPPTSISFQPPPATSSVFPTAGKQGNTKEEEEDGTRPGADSMLDSEGSRQGTEYHSVPLTRRNLTADFQFTPKAASASATPQRFYSADADSVVSTSSVFSASPEKLKGLFLEEDLELLGLSTASRGSEPPLGEETQMPKAPPSVSASHNSEASMSPSDVIESIHSSQVNTNNGQSNKPQPPPPAPSAPRPAAPSSPPDGREEVGKGSQPEGSKAVTENPSNASPSSAELTAKALAQLEQALETHSPQSESRKNGDSLYRTPPKAAKGRSFPYSRPQPKAKGILQEAANLVKPKKPAVDRSTSASRARARVKPKQSSNGLPTPPRSCSVQKRRSRRGSSSSASTRRSSSSSKASASSMADAAQRRSLELEKVLQRVRSSLAQSDSHGQEVIRAGSELPRKVSKL